MQDGQPDINIVNLISKWRRLWRIATQDATDSKYVFGFPNHPNFQQRERGHNKRSDSAVPANRLQACGDATFSFSQLTEVAPNDSNPSPDRSEDNSKISLQTNKTKHQLCGTSGPPAAQKRD